VERIVYYADVVPGLYTSYAMAASYTIFVTLLVSIAALFYLQVSGAFKREPEAA
jgi:hypothetical protein